MGRLIVSFVVIALILTGCKEGLSNNEDSSSNGTRLGAQTMPEDMPQNYGLSFSFRIGKKNEINTFKDLQYVIQTNNKCSQPLIKPSLKNKALLQIKMKCR